jgi:colicin import membrane protein
MNLFEQIDELQKRIERLRALAPDVADAMPAAVPARERAIHDMPGVVAEAFAVGDDAQALAESFSTAVVGAGPDGETLGGGFPPGAPGSPPDATAGPAARPRVGGVRDGRLEFSLGDSHATLDAQQVSALIEALARERAALSPGPPAKLPSHWDYVATRDPVTASQKLPNGDRLLVMRHTGHGWVAFAMSPQMIVQLYYLLSGA